MFLVLAFEGWFYIGTTEEQRQRNRAAPESSLAAALIEIRYGRPSGLKVTVPQFMPNSPSAAIRLDTRHDPDALSTAQSIRSSPDWEREFSWDMQPSKVYRRKTNGPWDALWFVVVLAVVFVLAMGLGGRLGSPGEVAGSVGLAAFVGLLLYGTWRAVKDGD